jgi:hypothetical protein
MPAPYHSIEDRMNRYLTGLTNARDVYDLQSRVALYGYTQDKLNQMLAQRQEAFDFYLAQKTEYSEQHAATETFEQAWQTAHESYMRLIRLGRIVFRDNYAVFIKLTLNEERKRTFSGWLAQANTFFSNLLSDLDALAKYAQYNTPLDAVNAAKALVNAAEQANIIQAKETGEAQQATKDRDKKMDALDNAMSEFYALAELACEDAPYLLEMLDR